MNNFTISLNGSNTKTVFKMNLSKFNSNMFSNWGTNLQGSTITANSIIVKTNEDYNFVKKAFTDLAKLDGNSGDISDADFRKLNDTQMGCGEPDVKKNIWHSHEEDEYNYHQGSTNSSDVGRTIWLSNHNEYYM